MRAAAALCATLLVSGGCAAEIAAPPPRTVVTVATGGGGAGGVYHLLGSAFARVFSERIPGLDAVPQATVGSVYNVDAIERGDADVAFTQVDVAYFAYSRGSDDNPSPHTRLRAMAVLYVNAVHILARRDGPIRQVSDFYGRRIGVGLAGSGTEVATRVIVEGHGIQYAQVSPEFLSFADVAAHLDDGTLDAGVISSSYPVPAITDAAARVGIRLVPVSRATTRRIRATYPFFKPMVIPAGTYRGQDEDIETIGIDTVLVCRGDLPEELVYSMTRALFEALPELAGTHRAAQLIDPQQAPATPIPLHPGAARYYRERELLQ